MSESDLMDSQELELLAGRALGNLSEEEESRLEVILDRSSSAGGILDDLEATAASFQLALISASESDLPDSLADRIRSEGRRIVGNRPSQQNRSSSIVGASVAKQSGSSGPGSVSVHRGGLQAREWLGWLCAAAAILLAVTMWLGGEGQSSVSPTQLTASEARIDLLENSDSVIRVDWTPGKTPFGQTVGGDVVWDPKSKKGFMRFVNMPVNEPTVEQYQLWIIDPQRDDEPVDGGVFDITETGEVVVAIDAKLDVIDPAAFAVTIEKPGGVVVSTQERLPLLAAVKS